MAKAVAVAVAKVKVNAINETDPNSMTNSRSPSSPLNNTEESEKTENNPKNIFNGWTPEQEKLYADWNEIASCCRWIHLQIDKIIHIKNVIINIPIVILSGLSRTAKIMVQVLFENAMEVIKNIKAL